MQQLCQDGGLEDQADRPLPLQPTRFQEPPMDSYTEPPPSLNAPPFLNPPSKKSTSKQDLIIPPAADQGPNVSPVSSLSLSPVEVPPQFVVRDLDKYVSATEPSPIEA